MLENLSTAIAIYGRDLHLMFFNTAYAHLWELDEDFLQGHPHLGDVLEALRDRRRFPEYPNFPAYTREVLQQYATLIAQEEELFPIVRPSSRERFFLYFYFSVF